MAVAVTMPKLGNTVESTILVRWHKQIGDTISIGDTLCDVETDKATMEVESTAAGVILALLYKEGDEIPVMVNIAVVGTPGEDVSAFTGSNAAPVAVLPVQKTIAVAPSPVVEKPSPGISPRARHLSQEKQIDLLQLRGTGPGGRIIERDVQAAASARLTPLAKSMVTTGDFMTPERGTGTQGRITKKDLIPAEATSPNQPPADGIEVIPLKGARKIIAARMLESLQTTAQLTLNASADAQALQAYRKRLKASDPALGLQQITINDLVLFAVSRTLPQFPDLNSLFIDSAIHRYAAVHLGMAVDTERGLLVPVIRRAQTLSLKTLADEAHRLAESCISGKVTADELNGGTFSVSNLGSLGIESFTPVLNPPQVAILGVGAVGLKPVETEDGVAFIPHLSLSLTINHQIVDGAPGARFLQALARNLGQIDLLVSL
jgi:pyruvate dehydrogenase E2 component (dihydrolipoyllysine-residue acetyltransferase)